MLTRTTSLAVLAVLAFATVAQADQYNARGGIDVSNATKRNSALVQAQIFKAKGPKANSPFGQRACGEERDGVTVVRRPDGEVVILADRINNFGGNIRIDPDCR
jgi:hypothetical protein